MRMVEPDDTRNLGRDEDGERGLSILFVIFQTGNRANGGVESITRVIEGLGAVRATVVTQMHTPVVDRWRAAGADVEVWERPEPGLPGRLGRMADVLRFNHRVDRLLRERSIEVVHCNDLLATCEPFQVMADFTAGRSHVTHGAPSQ